MDPLEEQKSLEHARIAKFQKLWRSKRVFSNSQIGWKVSPSSITTKIVTFKVPTNFRAVFESAPVGFTDIAGYAKSFKKPTVRWVSGQGWIGDDAGVEKLIAKRGQQTVVFTDKFFEVMGIGNWYTALVTIVKNGWAPKILLNAKPTYKKIDGIFYINKPFILEDLATELRRLPASFGAEVKYTQAELNFGIPAVVLKLAKPKWTYQFFKNGTVLFTGIKDPADKDTPRQLFKDFFSKYGLTALLAINLGKSPAIIKPAKGGNAKAKKEKLASRYRLVKSWNVAPPAGFYVRPGQDGKPRLYMWRKMEYVRESGEWVNRGEMKLGKKDATEVAKAYAKAGVPVPAYTLRVFEGLGIPIPSSVASVPTASVSTAKAVQGGRAGSWNAVATANGLYVRPGRGKQPYWFAIPKGIASGRKTVISAYASAGRNIPAEVRRVFKIPANVKTNVISVGGEAFNKGLQHVVKMGLNGILRINDRQVTRIQKPELLGIARNMGIPQVNSSMPPARIIKFIQEKAGVSNKPNRSYNVAVNGIFYKFLENGRVEKTTTGGVQTQRAWSTIPVTEQNKIAKTILPVNFHKNYEATAKANRFNTLRAILATKKPKAPPAKKKSPSPARSNSVSSNGNNNAAYARELEFATRLVTNLGNNYRNANEKAFLNNIYAKLPVGARGAPLKATVERAYAKFLKTTKGLRANNQPRARYMAKIVPPNWLPANKVQAYKNMVTNMAFQKPKPPSKKDLAAAIRVWLNAHAPQSPRRPARNVENAITGEVRRIPAYSPKRRTTPVLPTRTPPKPKPRKPKAVSSPRLTKEYAVPQGTPGMNNLTNALTNLGLPTGAKNKYTWAGLEKAGLDPKFRKVWFEKVASPKRN